MHHSGHSGEIPETGERRDRCRKLKESARTRSPLELTGHKNEAEKHEHDP
jgi:hypothetical protein